MSDKSMKRIEKDKPLPPKAIYMSATTTSGLATAALYPTMPILASISGCSYGYIP